jgi:hypothetical protein
MYKRIFEWLKTAIENRPIAFVIFGGIFTYFLACFVALILFVAFDWAGIAVVPFVSAFVVVGFHWFVARYERKSWLAQVIAIAPAGFFVLICLLSAHAVVDMQICWKHPDTDELICKIP